MRLLVEAERALFWAVGAPDLRRNIEGKGRDAREETLAAPGLHLVIADHEAGRRLQRAAAGVFEILARCEHRLLADDARPAHFLQAAEAVGDLPVTVTQLHGLGADILDAHVIGPDVTVVVGRGMLLEIKGPDRDFDRAGGFGIHGLALFSWGRRGPPPCRAEGAPGECRTRRRWRQGRRLAAGARRQQRQHLLVGSPRAVGADRLDANMVGAGVPMFLDALADRRLAAPGDIGIDEAVRAAAAEIVIAKAETPPIVDVIIEPHIGGERLAGSGTRLAGIAFKQDPDLGT